MTIVPQSPAQKQALIPMQTILFILFRFQIIFF